MTPNEVLLHSRDLLEKVLFQAVVLTVLWVLIGGILNWSV